MVNRNFLLLSLSCSVPYFFIEEYRAVAYVSPAPLVRLACARARGLTCTVVISWQVDLGDIFPGAKSLLMFIISIFSSTPYTNLSAEMLQAVIMPTALSLSHIISSKQGGPWYRPHSSLSSQDASDYKTETSPSRQIDFMFHFSIFHNPSSSSRTRMRACFEPPNSLLSLSVTPMPVG